MPDGGRLEIATGNVTLDAASAGSSLDLTPGSLDLTPGSYVMVSVRDTGCGMEPDVAARAFEPAL